MNKINFTNSNYFDINTFKDFNVNKYHNVLQPQNHKTDTIENPQKKDSKKNYIVPGFAGTALGTVAGYFKGEKAFDEFIYNLNDLTRDNLEQKILQNSSKQRKLHIKWIGIFATVGLAVSLAMTKLLTGQNAANK
ncbi:MAG: hypothetical protein PHV68_03785 [Candidatus Gastranaerophilales bacterium]|nr:hypothetical protein [Candidatus Gastranaerophilales bacterium]